MSDNFERNDMPVFPEDNVPPEKQDTAENDARVAGPVPMPMDAFFSVSGPPSEEVPAAETSAEEPAAAEVPAENAWNPLGNQTPPPAYAPYGGYQQYGQAPQSFTPQSFTQPPVPQYPYAPQTPVYNAAQYAANYQPPAPAPVKKSRTGLKVFFSLLGVAFLAVVALSVANFFRDRNNPVSDGTTAAAQNSPVVETKASPISPIDLPDDKAVALTTVQIAAKVKPSIVGVVVYANNSGQIASEGSGIIWKEDGTGYTYIITCAHVISGSGLSFTVQTEDGKQYDTERVGYDSKTDIGLLRVKATGLPAAEFGDSGALQVGDHVYAIGNPGGTEFFGSFTQGVVSAIDRSVKSRYTMLCIQHDAAINPGNSGGALVNVYGQVIGINSLKIIDTQYEGMGFAIPIKSAESVINSIAKNGYVPNRPKLGITYSEAISFQQYSMIVKIKGLPSGSLIIMEIGDESDFKNTKAQQYDMIIAVDKKPLATPSVLLDRIEQGKVGDKLTLTLCRIDNNYKTTEFDVVVALVEDKGDSGEPETTTRGFNPYDFFNGIY